MANICLYKIKVKGTKAACYALVNMMPLYSWEKDYLSEEGTDEDFTLVFSGACKWSVSAYTTKQEGLVPYTTAEIEAVEDGDGWHICLQDKSLLLGVDLYCNSKDIDDSCWSVYEHYNKGKEVYDDCPKELHIKRGRDYDFGYEGPGASNFVEKPVCRVRFADNRSYWYLGDAAIGDIVYVDGAKVNCMGQVKEVSTNTHHAAIYSVISNVCNVAIANPEDIEKIWTSYLKAKDRKAFLVRIGFAENTTKKQFITAVENLWLDFARSENNWDKFIQMVQAEQIKKED